MNTVEAIKKVWKSGYLKSLILGLVTTGSFPSKSSANLTTEYERLEANVLMLGSLVFSMVVAEEIVS